MMPYFRLFPAVLPLLLVAALLWTFLGVVGLAYAEARWIKFELCSHKTGKKTGPIQIEGYQSLGWILIRADQVSEIAPSRDTEDCTKVVLMNNTQATVLGNVVTILCKVNGTLPCEELNGDH